MTPDSPVLSNENAEKSLALASALFPGEAWVYKEPGIWVAESRLIEETQEPGKWEREISQVRILTSRGSVAYFLPEVEIKGETGKMSADLVLDGTILEMKTVAGNRETLGAQFKYGYKQGAVLAGQAPNKPEHSVYIRLLADITVGSVKAKIAGELKTRRDRTSGTVGGVYLLF